LLDTNFLQVIHMGGTARLVIKQEPDANGKSHFMGLAVSRALGDPNFKTPMPVLPNAGVDSVSPGVGKSIKTSMPVLPNAGVDSVSPGVGKSIKTSMPVLPNAGVDSVSPGVGKIQKII
jgi:hypothetical protein